MPLTFIAIDDHAIATNYWARLLPPYGATCVGEATTGEQGLALLKQTKPDLVLLDYLLPDMDGFELIAKSEHKTRWIMISAFSETVLIRKAAELGCCGIINKATYAQDQLELIVRVIGGNTDEMDAYCMKAVWADIAEPDRNECALIRGLVIGQSPASMAADLRISIRTFQKQRAAVIAKYRLVSPERLVTFAQQHHLMEYAIQRRVLNPPPLLRNTA